MTLLLLILIAFVFVYFVIKIIELERKVEKLEDRIHKISKKPEPLTDAKIEKELKFLLAEGRELEAIKQARQIYGLSLVESKQYVDRLKEV